jgi:hypothetical protein
MTEWTDTYQRAVEAADRVPDSDKHAVYGAEAGVELPANYCFTEFDSVAALCDAITTSEYWLERGGKMAHIEPVACVRQRSNAQSSRGGLYATGWMIRMLPSHWNVLVVCHELAHIMSFWQHLLPTGHNSDFRTEYLSLVRYVAPDLAGPLAARFREADLLFDVDSTGWLALPFDYLIGERLNGALVLIEDRTDGD